MIEFLPVMILMFVKGVAVGYLLWGPDTPFKQGFINGLTFRVRAWWKK